MLCLVIAQPLFGFILDWHAQHPAHITHFVYSQHDMACAMTLLLFTTGLALWGCFVLKETYGIKNKEE